MAFGWAKHLLKKKETLPQRVQICEHDLEDTPLVPMLPKSMRRRLELSWTKPQDAGLLRTANQMYRRMLETLTSEQIDELNRAFTYVETNEDYASLAANRPFKDKCYYILKMVDKLLVLLRCVPCLNDRVDRMLHGNRISERHFDMLKGYILWALELHCEHTFTARVKSAWGIFFACIWDSMEGSPDRYKIKQIQIAKEMERAKELERAKEMERAKELERAKEMERAKVMEIGGRKAKDVKKVKFDDRDMKKVKYHNLDIQSLKFHDIGVAQGGDQSRDTREDKGSDKAKTMDSDKAKAMGSDKAKAMGIDKAKAKGSDKAKAKEGDNDKKEDKDNDKAKGNEEKEEKDKTKVDKGKEAEDKDDKGRDKKEVKV